MWFRLKSSSRWNKKISRVLPSESLELLGSLAPENSAALARETFINIGDYRALISIALYDINKLEIRKNRSIQKTTSFLFFNSEFSKKKQIKQKRRWSALLELFRFQLRTDPSLELLQDLLRGFLALNQLFLVFNDRILEFSMKISKPNSTRSTFGRTFTRLELKWSLLKMDGKSKTQFLLPKKLHFSENFI